MKISPLLKQVFSLLIFLSFSYFIIYLFKDSQRAWMSFLTSWFYFVSISLIGLLFVCLHHIGNASWFTNLRRLFESFSAFLYPCFFLGLIFMIFGASELYSWLDPIKVARDPLLEHKAPYLNQSFFWIRYLVFFLIWMALSFKMIHLSLAQDKKDETSLKKKMIKYSVIFTLLFALTYSLFSLDFLMSLEPHWFSTIYGLYTFSGSMQASLSIGILLIIYLQKKGYLKEDVTKDHLHDLGKYLLGFSIFWAYIAFSQYMLIWYANLPEETLFYKPRSQAPWLYVSISLIVFKFILPFIYLLPRFVKRSKNYLIPICLILVGMQYVDLYWLSYPNLDPHKIHFGFIEISNFVLFLSLFLFSVFYFLSKNPLTPLKDPRKEASKKHHVVY